jgi:hypothetical protein
MNLVRVAVASFTSLATKSPGQKRGASVKRWLKALEYPSRASGGSSSRGRQSISVAVRILAVPRWRRRASRIVGYAVGNVGFSFTGSKRRQHAIGMVPTEILDPLWGG